MTITILISVVAGFALLLSFVLGVTVTDKIYAKVYDRAEDREAGRHGRSGNFAPERSEPVTPAVPDADKKHLYEAEQKAFDDCMKYNIDQAYDVLK